MSCSDQTRLGEIHSVTLVARSDGIGPSSKTKVLFIRGFDLNNPNIAAATSQVSVLHPRDCRSFSLPPDGASFGIAFLAARHPLEILFNTDQLFQQRTLFGCGLCSVVVVSDDTQWLDQLVATCEPKLYGWERWAVRDGELIERRHSDWVAPSDECPIVLKAEGVQDDSTVWMIQELSLNFNHFFFNAQRFAPYMIDELKTLADEVVELIDEIKEDERILFVDQVELESRSEQTASDNNALLHRKKRLNTNVDLLVQLNSAFVYAVGQAFHGALPIFQRGGHISQHSLLGTGSAWRAIHRICSTAFTAFRKSRFPEKLRERLDANGRDESPSRDESTVGGNLAGETVEQLSAELRLNMRIVHFSARRGFGESDGAITCPSQALQVCNEPEWSLSTTTHEILHAHVRELIAAVLCETSAPETPLPQEQSLAIVVDDYEKFAIAAKRGPVTPSLLNEVRFGLVEFALSYRNAVDKAKTKYRISQPEFETEEIFVTLPKQIEGTFRAVKKSFRLLEETLVHILDLHYFYRGDVELFCDSIWYGWSIVPSVIEKLDWYILRTLLTLSSRASGDDYERLAAAAEILSDSLNRIQRQKKGFVIASEVLRRIFPLRQDLEEREDSSFFKWIDLLFPACLPLVDVTTKFFLSPSLVRDFSRQEDDFVDHSGRYALEAVDFSVKQITNPISLVYDRLRRSLETDGVRALSHDEIARRSAFLLLAASSPPIDIEEVPA